MIVIKLNEGIINITGITLIPLMAIAIILAVKAVISNDKKPK